jgi:magnesium transporter
LSLFPGRESLDELPRAEDCELFWLDLRSARPSDIEWVGHRYQLHALAIEDCLHADQRPKVEDYSGHLFVVAHAFELPKALSLSMSDAGAPEHLDELLNSPLEEQIRELHSFLLPNGVITVHDGVIRSLEVQLQKAAQDRTWLPLTSDLLLHRVLDALVEAQPRYLDVLDQAIEALDQEVLVERRGAHALERVHALQNHLNFVRRVLGPEGEVFKQLHEEDFAGIRKESLPWFRDLLDHSVRIQARIAELRENLWTIRDAFLAIAAHRTNEAMRRLTVLSVIFLPLTFITGFFGMNFEALPYGNVLFLQGLLAVVILLPLGMLLWFASKRWW